MADEIIKKNSIADQQNEAVRTFMNREFYPTIVEGKQIVVEYSKFPISRIPALGIAFEPLAAAFQFVSSGGELASGLCKVTIPKGAHLAKFQDGSGFTSCVLKENGAVGGGQARLNPLVCDPTMLFMAMAMANIDKKLDSIQEIQREMLDFLVQKERSELKGDLNFLFDILNNYKYNLDNEKYKASNHIKVLDIRQSAERKMDFYREQIASKIKEKSFFHSDQDVIKQLEKVQTEFKDYQLALYLYSFSMFLEIMLLENFSAEYLDKIVEKIEEYSNKYRELYTSCFNQLEDYAESSIQSNLIKGLAYANLIAGVALEKVPLINKTQFDERLAEAGYRINRYGLKRVEQTIQQRIDKQSLCIRPFVDNINIVNKLYNQPTELFFDDENLYLGGSLEL